MTPGPQFHQLDLFRPAHELRDGRKTVFGDRLPGEHHAALFGSKLRESKDEGLHASIQRHGIDTPVELVHDHLYGAHPDRPLLTNGHHRVAVAHDLDPKMLVPVKHSDNAQYAHQAAAARGRRDPFGDPVRLSPTRKAW